MNESVRASAAARTLEPKGHPLAGVRAKLARAREHIKQIHEDIVVNRKVRFSADSVRAQLRFKAKRLDDPSTYQKEIIFFLKGVPPPLDLSFTILAGEAVHHLRTALDHLVYQLVVASTAKPPQFKSAFPIVGKGRMKKSGWVSAEGEYAARTNQLRTAISSTAESRITSLQPFRRGPLYEDDPLWVLQELDNAYKHRLLLLTVHRVTNYWVTVTSCGKSVKGSFQPDVPFKHGVEIGRLQIADPDFSIADTDVSLDGDIVIQVAFANVVEVNGFKASVLTTLNSLANSVTAVIDQFEPEFGDTT